MGKIIAVSGKGGVGKTIVSTLLLKWLNKLNITNILIIDADPNSCLPAALNVEYTKTVGDIREELLRNPPAGMDKNLWFETKVFEITVQTKRFDLIVMGRPEGSGCYCFVNNLTREVIANVSTKYDYIIIDCEAGLEHLSRRTTADVDVMIIVSDTSEKGLITAKRIVELSKELEIKFKKIFFIVNRVKNDVDESTIENIIKKHKLNIELLGILRESEEISRMDAEGIPIYYIDETTQIFEDFGKIVERLLEKVEL